MGNLCWGSDAWTRPNADAMILDDVGPLLVAGLSVAKVKTALPFPLHKVLLRLCGSAKEHSQSKSTSHYLYISLATADNIRGILSPSIWVGFLTLAGEDRIRSTWRSPGMPLQKGSTSTPN